MNTISARQLKVSNANNKSVNLKKKMQRWLRTYSELFNNTMRMK